MDVLLSVFLKRAQDTKFQKDTRAYFFFRSYGRVLMFPSFFIKLIFMLFALASSNQPIDMYICICVHCHKAKLIGISEQMQKRGRQQIPIFLFTFLHSFCAVLCPDTLASQLFFSLSFRFFDFSFKEYAEKQMRWYSSLYKPSARAAMSTLTSFCQWMSSKKAPFRLANHNKLLSIFGLTIFLFFFLD